MRVLAIDLGDVRTGLAAGDDLTDTVQPLEVIEERTPKIRMEKIERAIQEFGPDQLLVGLPINMDETEGPRARDARTFAAEISRRTGIPVHLQDERLTSFAAEEHLKQSGRTHKQKKKVRDALAAVEMIQDYFRGS